MQEGLQCCRTQHHQDLYRVSDTCRCHGSCWRLDGRDGSFALQGLRNRVSTQDYNITALDHDGTGCMHVRTAKPPLLGRTTSKGPLDMHNHQNMPGSALWATSCRDHNSPTACAWLCRNTVVPSLKTACHGKGTGCPPWATCSATTSDAPSLLGNGLTLRASSHKAVPARCPQRYPTYVAGSKAAAPAKPGMFCL